MKFRGRSIDPVKLWEGYVDFPLEFGEGTFSPLVLCPNPEHHNTRSPAFQVNLEQPTVHCFSRCGIEGSYEHAICVIHGLYEKHKVTEAKCVCGTVQNPRCEFHKRRRIAYRDARKIIFKTALTRSAKQRDTTVRAKGKARKRDSGPDVVVPDLGYAPFIPQAGIEYLTGVRGISGDSIATWDLGWDAERGRIVIPGKDLDGVTRFLIRRAVRENDHPKYLYSEGFPKTSLLFGACQTDLGMIRSSELIVVEGSLDTIRLHQHGFANTVGTLGTGISERQGGIVARLRPKRIVLFFDRDIAGIQGIEIARRVLRKAPLYIARYPKAKHDPAELSREEVARAVDRALPMLKFLKHLPGFGTSGFNRSPTSRKEIRVG